MYSRRSPEVLGKPHRRHLSELLTAPSLQRQQTDCRERDCQTTLQFNAVANRTVGALIIYIAFLLGSGPRFIVLHYAVGASTPPTSVLAVLILFVSVPTLAAIYQLIPYISAANKEALRKDKLRNAPLDEVNAKILMMRKKFVTTDFRLKRLEVDTRTRRMTFKGDDGCPIAEWRRGTV